MITIADQPPAAACALCWRPLAWLYSARTGAWVSFATDPADRDTLHVHRCREGHDERDWRVPQVPRHRLAAGAAKVRAAMGWNQPTRTLTAVATVPTEGDR